MTQTEMRDALSVRPEWQGIRSSGRAERQPGVLELLESNLQEANLRGANLSTTKGLTEQQIMTARINENTKLPPDLAHLLPLRKKDGR